MSPELQLLIVTVLLLRAQRHVLGRRGYAVVGGKYGEPRRIALGAWRWAALALCLAVLSLPVFMPYAALMKAAFTRIRQGHIARGRFSPSPSLRARELVGK